MRFDLPVFNYVWPLGVACGIYFAASPLILVLTSCAFIVFNMRGIFNYIKSDNRMSTAAVWIFCLVGLIALSYQISVLVNFTQFNTNFFYWLLYGPTVFLLFVAGFFMQRKLVGLLMEDCLALALAVQILFIFFSRDVSFVREIAIGQIIFLPVAIFSKKTGWRNLVSSLFVFFSGMILAFSDQRSLLVAIFFELLAFNIARLGKRSVGLTIIFLLGFVLGCVFYTQSLVVEPSVLNSNNTSEKAALNFVPAISKRVGDGTGKGFVASAGHLFERYSDRLGLYEETYDKVTNHSFFGFSKNIPYQDVIMGSESPVIKGYKSIHYTPSHPHSFMLRNYYDIGIFSLF